MRSLYILEIKPLSEVSMANMFSHIVGFLIATFKMLSYTSYFYTPMLIFINIVLNFIKDIGYVLCLLHCLADSMFQ